MQTSLPHPTARVYFDPRLLPFVRVGAELSGRYAVPVLGRDGADSLYSGRRCRRTGTLPPSRCPGKARANATARARPACRYAGHLVPSDRGRRRRIPPGGFEPPSPAPKAGMIDHYTTGVRTGWQERRPPPYSVSLMVVKHDEEFYGGRFFPAGRRRFRGIRSLGHHPAAEREGAIPPDAPAGQLRSNRGPLRQSSRQSSGKLQTDVDESI